MRYFETLPKIIKTDNFGNATILTNLMARASLIPELMKNPSVYYTYDIQEGDTPESIAHKYYGDVYRYWIVLFANQIIDPQWQWPMSSNVFAKYLQDKYPTIDVNSTPYRFVKVITSTDKSSLTVNEEIVSISEEEYDTFVNSETSYNLPTGQVTVNITAKPVSLFEYENEKNEKNRTISIIKSQYATQLERQLKSLMKS
jgi:hypothetical protein